jgi:hypothetical protein
MKFGTAVNKLGYLAEQCQALPRRPTHDVAAVYVFGDFLDGGEPVESIPVVLALDRPPSEVPWLCSPRGADYLIERLNLGACFVYWRSHQAPVWNHLIRGPVKIWSLDDGVDSAALEGLRQRDFGGLRRLTASPEEEERWHQAELELAFAHLREIRDKYWDRNWRHAHRGLGRYPENTIWEAAEGYLDLLDASPSSASSPSSALAARSADPVRSVGPAAS